MKMLSVAKLLCCDFPYGYYCTDPPKRVLDKSTVITCQPSLTVNPNAPFYRVTFDNTIADTKSYQKRGLEIDRI